MEFKQLQSFAAVVRCRSFTQAARQLFTSQPTVSTHLRQLEEELQTRLIVRTTKTIEVTPRGRELYEFAVRVLALRDDLVGRWAAENGQVIRLGASTIPSAYILPEVLPAFRRRQPGVGFNIHQSDSEGVIRGLLAGQFDVGLVGMRTGDEALEFLPFYRDELVLITPVNEHYLQMQAGGGFPPEAFLHEPILLREEGSGSKKCIARYFEQLGLRESDLNVTARLNDQESIKSLVAGGLGISILSEKAARDPSGRAAFLIFSLPRLTAGRSLYLVRRRDETPLPHTCEFIEFVQAFYAPGP